MWWTNPKICPSQFIFCFIVVFNIKTMLFKTWRWKMQWFLSGFSHFASNHQFIAFWFRILNFALMCDFGQIKNSQPICSLLKWWVIWQQIKIFKDGLVEDLFVCCLHSIQELFTHQDCHKIWPLHGVQGLKKLLYYNETLIGKIWNTT